MDNFSPENYWGNAGNQTKGLWVRSKYATSELCSPHPGVNTTLWGSTYPEWQIHCFAWYNSIFNSEKCNRPSSGTINAPNSRWSPFECLDFGGWKGPLTARGCGCTAAWVARSQVWILLPPIFFMVFVVLSTSRVSTFRKRIEQNGRNSSRVV